MSDEMRVEVAAESTPVLDGFDLTPEERAEFDYIDWPAVEEGTDSASFFRHGGTVYDLGQFMSTRGLPESSPLTAWDGFLSDSAFSAVVVKYVKDDNDDDAVRVGLALS